MRNTLVILSAALAIGTMPAGAFAQSASTTVPKNGSCPSGFSVSGGTSCKSMNGRTAMPYVGGTCPSNWNRSGNYCVSYEKGAQGMVKDGGCPSGFSTSGGKYCVKN